MVAQPGPKALRLQRFTPEDHSLQLKLLFDVALLRVDGRQCIKGRRSLTENVYLFGHQQGSEVVG